MEKRFYKAVIAAILSYFVTCSCEESNEESEVRVEYLQIFRNIPKIFEYFLNVLEQRVQVLEYDDITTFLETPKSNEIDTKDHQDKRETKDYCYDNEYYNENLDERNMENCDEKINKRQSSQEKRDHRYTTEEHEYGRSSEPKGHLDYKEEDGKTDLQEEVVTDFVRNTNKRHTDINNEKKKYKKNRIKRPRVKKSAIDVDEGFLGIDWSQFYLAPEEVADKAIETEQMLEEYNSKKNRK